MIGVRLPPTILERLIDWYRAPRTAEAEEEEEEREIVLVYADGYEPREWSVPKSDIIKNCDARVRSRTDTIRPRVVGAFVGGGIGWWAGFLAFTMFLSLSLPFLFALIVGAMFGTLGIIPGSLVGFIKGPSTRWAPYPWWRARYVIDEETGKGTTVPYFETGPADQESRLATAMYHAGMAKDIGDMYSSSDGFWGRVSMATAIVILAGAGFAFLVFFNLWSG